MKKEKSKDSGRIKERRFALSLFAIYWGVLLLMSGIHSGLVVMMERLQWNGFVKSCVPILYWSIVAVGLTPYALTLLQIH